MPAGPPPLARASPEPRRLCAASVARARGGWRSSCRLEGLAVSRGSLGIACQHAASDTVQHLLYRSAGDQPSPGPVDEVADDRVLVETQGPEELERTVRGLVPGPVAAELGHRSVGRRGQAAVRAN